MTETLTDEFGFACDVQVPDRPVASALPEYLCECGTKFQPWLDAACPIHGRFNGLPHAVAARQKREAL